MPGDLGGWAATESRTQNLGEGALGELDDVYPCATVHHAEIALIRVISD